MRVEKGYGEFGSKDDFEIKSTTTMSTVRKLLPILLLVCAQVWAQSGSPSQQGSDPAPQTAQPSQPPADSDTKTLPDQTSSTPLPDSTKLEPIKTQKATYPYEAQEQKLQGEVVVKIRVSETGDVESVEVVSGDPILAKSAVDAVKKWKFKPFIKNGKPMKVSAKLPFDFAFSQNITDAKEPEANAGATPAGAEVPKRVRVSPGVTTGLVVHKVQPVYPPEARRAGIQGTVLMRAVISKEGTIANLQLISGPKELVKAAMGAVQQWRYKPYLLKGDPVEVDTEIAVNFTLSYR
jgi:TonB family protein